MLIANKLYKHDNSVHWIDAAIAQAVLSACIAGGYSVRIFDGEEWAHKGHITNTKEAEEFLFATEEEVVYVYQNGKQVGFVFFVWGNSGWDAINDNTTTLDALGLMKDAEFLSERFGDDTDIPVFHVGPTTLPNSEDVIGFAVYTETLVVSPNDAMTYEDARELCRKLNFGEEVLLGQG